VNSSRYLSLAKKNRNKNFSIFQIEKERKQNCVSNKFSKLERKKFEF
jgi:hypothetical protein